MGKRIVFVSRLDSDCALGARILCSLAPRLEQRYPGIEIVIVGGGSELTEIRSLAHGINKNINRRLIDPVGYAEDVSIFYKNVDGEDNETLFVGVSRAALEAMGHGLPVILLGNEGYLGLFDESKQGAAMSANFTARGQGFGAQASGERSGGTRNNCARTGCAQADRAHTDHTHKRGLQANELLSKRTAFWRSRHAEKQAPPVLIQDTGKIEPYFILATCGCALEKANITPEDVARVLCGISEHFDARAVIAILNPRDDLEISQRIAKSIPDRILVCPKDADGMKRLAEGAKFCICQRYHGALFSLACGAPTVAVSDDPKMRALCREFDLTPAVSPKYFFKSATDGCFFQLKLIEAELERHRRGAEETARAVEQCALRADKALCAVLRELI